MDKIIKVGIGVMLVKDNKVLLGHRVNDAKDTGGIYEPGSWTLPGGKQDYGETIFECAIRETKEETNLDLKEENLEVLLVTDDISSDKHYITISMLATDYDSQEQVMEPEKIDEWKWFNLSSLPANIYSPSKKTINAYLKREEDKK